MLTPIRSQREVAHIMGISHTRVTQLEQSALAKLRTELIARLGCEEIESITGSTVEIDRTPQGK